MLTGSETIQEAIGLCNELNHIVNTAGLELRKWASNDPRILSDKNGHNNEPISIYGDKDSKTLGLVWNPRNDELKYSINIVDSHKVTKRIVLSIIAQIFDPLGLVGRAIIQAKVIMQKLWSMNLDWDGSLPQELYSSWCNIYKEILNINKIVINRHARSSHYTKLEFHGFCDTSETVYGACIYIYIYIYICMQLIKMVRETPDYYVQNQELHR